jgi:DcmR-like sensory protein
VRTSIASPNVTECGIPGIKLVPYGIHLCHLYQGRQELLDSLVPYFQAGLRLGDRCLWITAPPLTALEAQAEMAKLLPNLDAILRDGHLRIIDASDWYASTDGFRAEEVIKRWLKEEEDVLAQGFNGLRIAENASFLMQLDPAALMDYEHAVTEAFQERSIVALCSFDLHQCQATDVFDMIQAHHFTLDRPDDHWQVLEPREFPERSIRVEALA